MPFDLSQPMLWLIAGVVCLAAEALGVNGVGFLFAGLGALTIGTITTAMPEIGLLMQWVIFLAATGIWTIFLWKPLQRFYGKTQNDGYKNIVGDTALISGSGLKQGEIGEATWSGTIMKAELASGQMPLAAGDRATIVAVSGNKLIVKAKD